MGEKYRIRDVNYGWNKRKHGILLGVLPPNKQKLLLETKFFRWMQGERQTFQIIFRVDDMNRHEKINTKLLWNPFKDTFTTLKELQSDSNLVDWHCAICEADIMTRMDSKNVENFVCNKCIESHNSSNDIVDARIIKSSQEFNKHCKKLLTKEQREFFNYVKKSAK